MKINANAFGLAAGIISSALSLLCTILIALIPGPTMNFSGWLIHMNRLADIFGPRTVTLGNGIVGVVGFFIIGYILGWLFAAVYNKFTK